MNDNYNEINALIALLDDPDVTVHQPVLDRLVEVGPPAVKLLEKTWESASERTVQERIEKAVYEIQASTTRKDLKDWVDCSGDQLLYGAYLLARVQYPDLSYEDLDQKIELLRSQIWLELNDRLTALEKIKVINHFLFKVHSFNRSIRSIQSPQLYYINHVLETQKGLPITLSIIYAEIAARLDLPVYCVDLPRNFLLCYRDRTYLDDPDGILFYINPYTQGTVLGRPEILHFLEEQKIEQRPEYMRPCSNIRTIGRLAEGLRYAYTASHMDSKIPLLDDLMGLLKSRQTKAKK